MPILFMNLILLSSPDFISPSRVRLTGRRFDHIQDILKARKGQVLSVGRINGLMGQGTVAHKTKEALELDVTFSQKPPQALPLTLILALPRPPMLKRILFSAAMLGVKQIILLNFSRVEKSLWQSSALQAGAIKEQLILGLEQALDTVLPKVKLIKRFKPFVEDQLPALMKGKQALVAHPYHRLAEGGETRAQDPMIGAMKKVLIIGPEGGILDYEIGLLQKAGCQILDLGPRILRTDNVLPLIVGRLF